MAEAAYDALVREHLAAGIELAEALKMAGLVYPDEELRPVTEPQWESVRAHYEVW